MKTWEKQPAWQGPVVQGCANCPTVERVAPMDMVIGVGFGIAQVTRDKQVIFQETMDMNFDDLPTLQIFEDMAQADPDHDWRVLLEAPLRSREYQRHGEGEWVLIHSGMGFA